MADNGTTYQSIFPVDRGVLRQSRLWQELRLGRPIMLHHEGQWVLYAASETLDNDIYQWMLTQQHEGQAAAILISDKRADVLKIPSKGSPVVALKMPRDWSLKDLHDLSEPHLDLEHPLRGPFKRLSDLESPLSKACLSLTKAARLLPAGLMVPVADSSAFERDILSLDIDHNDITTPQEQHLKLVARAHVPLEHSEETIVVMFRPLDGGMEHMALIIGKPDLSKPVLMRLHSECFTGDLMASLKCDCGDQLKGAIKAIADAGGGVLLYLAQEGRGIGLPAKLKAYALQDQGFDTVDANLRLGFEVDERVFSPAIQMLKHLHIKSIRLLTNNPLKVAALKEAGFDVVERVAHHFPSNQHNDHYLTTKKTRTGHLL